MAEDERIHAAHWDRMLTSLSPDTSTTTPASSTSHPSSQTNTPEQNLALIQHNLQEIISPKIIEDIVLAAERPLRIYWGTATTGKPHCGYFVPMLKIAEFLAAGCQVKILLADVHGFLDNLKAPIELVAERVKYYKFTITALLEAVGVDLGRLVFVTGSEYQTTGASGAAYFMDLLRLSTAVSGHDASKAGSEVVKQVDSPPLSSQLYPLMQALDEEYLGVDAQFGGLDQRKIFTLATEVLPRVGFAKRAHLLNPLIPGLQEGGKMSSSDPDSKIDLIDDETTVRKKLKKAFCPPKQVEGNGVLAFVEYVLLPASALRSPDNKPRFAVPLRDRPEQPLIYTDIKAMHEDYANDILQPQALKPAVTDALLELLTPIRKAYEASREWQEVEARAYPAPASVPAKKEKKVKNLGTGHPGAKGKVNGGPGGPGGAVEAKADGGLVGEDAEAVSVGKSQRSVSGSGSAIGAEEKMRKLSLASNGGSSKGHAKKGSKG